MHALQGDLVGQWSVTVNGHWRLTFRFENGDALLVDYQDYHENINKAQMHNSPHPGEVLRERLGDMEVCKQPKPSV